mgnify:CR=1 FL=1
MKRLFAILFALFCTMPLFCQDREVDSLLRVLDASVQGRERYTLERQSQINALQCQLKATRSDAELLEIYQELFGKYSAYRMDSALWAANRCVEVAQRMSVASHLYSARMRVAETGLTMAEYFRDQETNLLKELQEESNLVISCGGGAALRACNVAEMKKNGRVVLLTASPEVILDRVKDSDDRPVLKGRKSIEGITELMEQRRERYEAAADIVIQTDHKSVQEICEELIQRLSEMDEE